MIDRKSNQNNTDNALLEIACWINERKNAFEVWTEVLLLAATILLDYLIFSGMFADFYEMFRAGGNWGIYFLLSFSFAFILKRFITRVIDSADKFQDFTFEHVGFIVMWIPLLAVTFFLSVTTYAYTIFPFIPNAKGGGNYVGMTQSEVRLTRATPTSGEDIIRNVIIFYSTDTSIYLAPVEEGNGPCQWRSRLIRPTIIEIPRWQVRSLNSNSAVYKWSAINRASVAFSQ